MGESAKALLGGLIFLCVFGAIAPWAHGVPSTPLVWALRIGFPVMIVAAVAMLYRANHLKDVEPDFLRALVGKPFERDGVCFSVSPTSANGVCFLNIIYQNQYSSPCRLKVLILPPDKDFLGNHTLPGVVINIDCEGGGFGVARAPFGVPAKYQGIQARFDVGATTRYPHGKGKLLRFRNGLRAGKADSSGMGSAALTLGLLALGHVHMKRPATVRLTLPMNVAESTDSSHNIFVQVLWRPGDDPSPVARRLQLALLPR